MPRKIADMMAEPHVRKTWACLACGRPHPSADEARQCGCHTASEAASAELERAVLAGARTEQEETHA